MGVGAGNEALLAIQHLFLRALLARCSDNIMQLFMYVNNVGFGHQLNKKNGNKELRVYDLRPYLYVIMYGISKWI